MTGSHLVAREVLEFSAGTEDSERLTGGARALQSQVLAGLVEECLDELAPLDDVVRLGRVEIDLGHLPAELLDELSLGLADAAAVHVQLRSRVTVALEEAVAEARAQQQAEPSADLELLRSFVQAGVLPWWANGRSDRDAIAAAVLRALAARRDELQRWLQELSDDGWRRLVRSLSEAAAAGLLRALTTTARGVDALAAVDVIERVLPGSAPRETAWTAVLRAAIEPPRPAPMFQRALSYAADAVGVRRAQLLSRLRALPEGTPEPFDEPELFDEPVVHRELTAPAASRPGPESAEPANAPPEEGDEDSAIPVANAGLVLLAPFLRAFLVDLGLVDEDGQFVDSSARSRAVYRLAACADPDPEPPEYRLALAKVLCGAMPVDLLHPPPPVLEEDTVAIRRLLQAVTSHRDALGTLSEAGLRATFLQREGVLAGQPGAWLLRVSPGPVDLLLDRLPWSVDVVAEPWMSLPVIVEWRRSA